MGTVAGTGVKKRVNYLRKAASVSMAALVALQVAALPANALQSSVVTYSNESKRTVVLDVAQGEDALQSSLFDLDLEIARAEEKASVQKIDYSTQERQEYVEVPLYFQTDYPEVMYGSGTIETSGCSITSLAMVATYLTGYDYLPDELAGYFGGRAENNIARLEYGAEVLQLPYEKPENWHGALAALKEGKTVIALMNANSIFTESQHFIVLTGVTEDGKILVNDSYAPNYEKWDLKKGFEEGFEEYQLWQGYEGAWVFDKAAMPDKIQRYYEVEPEKPEPRYPDIELSFAEKQLLARVVWVESRGESAEGQQAGAEAVLNRMASENVPDDIREVLYAEGQFRSVPYLDDAEPTQAQYEAIENAIYGPYVLPEKVVYFATYSTNDYVWGTIGGHIFCYENADAAAAAAEQN